MNLEWIFIPYISAIQGMESICVTLQNILNLMGWIFILQGDEMQGMILIQDEGMDFQPSNIWILLGQHQIHQRVTCAGSLQEDAMERANDWRLMGVMGKVKYRAVGWQRCFRTL
jgi:hypothetical protein